jgi:hypothetical protein
MGAADIGTAAITGQVAKTSIAPADQFLMYDSVGVALKKVAGNLVQRFSRGYLVGLKVSNNATDAANDIDIATGECRSDDDTEDMVLGTALTKRLDAAWVAGTNQGGRDTGTLTDLTSWHLYLIKNPTTGVVDALFTQTLGAPTMPSGFTVKRRLFSFTYRASSGVNWGGIWPFKQLPGDYFQSQLPTLEATATVAFGLEFTVTLTAIPVGLKLRAIVHGRCNSAAGPTQLALWDVDVTNGNSPVGHCFSGAANQNSAVEAQVFCNTSAQIRAKVGGGSGTTGYYICTLGFFDTREKDF